MMGGRQDSIRCENCCYFVDAGPAHQKGWCHRNPPTKWETSDDVVVGPDGRGDEAFVLWPEVYPSDDFCGEFRQSWPLIFPPRKVEP